MIRALYPEKFQDKVRFDWSTNRPTIMGWRQRRSFLHDAAVALNWDAPAAVEEYLPASAYLGGKMNCLLVIDESHKFTSYRLKTLELYKEEVPTSFSIAEYIRLCHEHAAEADRYQRLKKRSDFNFEGGASAKRAMLDVLLDVLPLNNGLNPTLRLHEFELAQVETEEQLKEMIETKIHK